MRIPTSVVLVSICCGLLSSADESTIQPMPTTAKEKAAEPDRKAIEALVAQLAVAKQGSKSRCRLPFPSFNFPFPKDFDSQAQERVMAAHEKLVGLSTDAFPILIEHLNDKGYSRSVEITVLSGLSVGQECFYIIEQQVDVAGMRYIMREGSDGEFHVHRGYFSQFSDNEHAYYTAEGVRRWWKEHQRQSLSSTVSHPTALVVNACGLCWSWTTFLYMRSRLSHSRWKTGIEAQDEFAGHFWGGKRLCTTVARSSWQPTSYIDP